MIRGYGAGVPQIRFVNATANVLAADFQPDVIYTNTGASGTIVINLPNDAPVGTILRAAITEDSQEIRVTPHASDTIIYSGKTSGQFLSSGVSGATLQMVANGAGKWVVLSTSSVLGPDWV